VHDLRFIRLKSVARAQRLIDEAGQGALLGWLRPPNTPTLA